MGQIGAIASVATVYFASGYGLRGDHFALGMAGMLELLDWARKCELNGGTACNRSEAYWATLGGVFGGRAARDFAPCYRRVESTHSGMVFVSW